MTLKLASPGPAELSRLYIDQKFSVQDLAGHYQVSSRTVNNWLIEAQVELRPSLYGRKQRRAKPTPTTSCLPGRIHHWHCETPNGEDSRAVCQVCGTVKQFSNSVRWQRPGKFKHPEEHPV